MTVCSVQLKDWLLAEEEAGHLHTTAIMPVTNCPFISMEDFVSVMSPLPSYTITMRFTKINLGILNV